MARPPITHPPTGALNFVVKDGIGQLGTLMGTRAIAHNFDLHSKTWFFISMLKLNVGGDLAALAPCCAGRGLIMV